MKDEAGLPYYMALPEKALVDFIYLNQKHFTGDYKSELTESFRLQNTDKLNKKKLINYVKLFANPKITAIVKQVR